MRPLVLALAAALAALAPRAQPVDATASGRAWGEGERREAYRAVLDRLRLAPSDTAAWQVRLDLEVAGASSGPPFLKARRARRTARALLALDSTNARAHTVLGQDALKDVLLYRHRISVESQASRFGPAFAVEGRDAAELSPVSEGVIGGLVSERGAVDASGPAAESAVRAARHLTAALRSAPGGLEATRALATVWLVLDRTDDLASLADATLTSHPDRPEGWLLSGLAAIGADDPSRADVAFGQALGRMGPADRARYDDVAPLVSSEDGASPDPAAFWSGRDPRLLTAVNERRVEHLGRVAYADFVFGHGDTPGAETARGNAFVRYGAPPARYEVTLGQPPSRFDVWQYDGFRYVFADAFLSGRYVLSSPPAEAFGRSARSAARAETDDAVLTDRRMQRTEPERSQIRPGTLDLDGLVTAFRGSNGQTDLVVALGAEGGGQQGRTGAFLLRDGRPLVQKTWDGQRVQAGTGWVATSTLQAAPGPYTLALEAEVDGAFGERRRDLDVPRFAGPDLQISGLLLATSFDDVAAGPAPVQRGDLAIVPSATGRYPAGDLVVLYAEVYGLSSRGGRTDASVETVLVPEDSRSGLRKLWDGVRGRRGRGAVSVATDLSGAASTESIALTVDTAGQAPGRYRLQLRIEDRVAGSSVEAERAVQLLE